MSWGYEEGEIPETQNAFEGSKDSFTTMPNIHTEYEFVSNLGQGGFGKVDKFKNRITGKLVAVKVAIHEQSRIDQQREVQILTSMTRHANIGKLIEYRPNEDRIVFAAYGPDLEVYADEFMENGVEIPEAFVFHVFNQLTSALAHIHGSGVVHRDIKPSNIVLNYFYHGPTGCFLFPRVVLIDFGLAKASLEPHRSTCGTPKFGVPEHEIGWHSEASDIYSVGAVIHSLCTDRPPKAEAPAGHYDKHSWYRDQPQTISRIVKREHGLEYLSATHFDAQVSTFLRHRRFPPLGYSHILEWWMRRALDDFMEDRVTIGELSTKMKIDADRQIMFWTKWVRQVCRPQRVEPEMEIAYPKPPLHWRPE